MDLGPINRYVLTPELGPQAIPTGVYGPTPKGMFGLLLGRSSLTLKGLQVFPGVIDADYEGEIKIMASAPRNIITITSDMKIAQLILLPLPNTGNLLSTESRGAKAFGSSDKAYWVQAISHKRPEKTLLIQGKRFTGILDTGADVSVISLVHWPKQWPYREAITQLQGIGQTNSPLQSSQMLKWQDNKGHSGLFRPYVLPEISVNLWGRDILSALSAALVTAPAQGNSNLG